MKTLPIVLLAFLSLVFGQAAQAVTFTDALGRKVEVPDHVAHVLPAGPPAAVALYTLAPEKMLGWMKPFSAAEHGFLAPRYGDLPVVGRLTGHEATIGAEDVKKLHPDLIVDIGTLNSNYAKLADKIQDATGIPYVVLDGSIAATPDMYRQLGALLGTQQRASQLASAAATMLANVATSKSGDAKTTRIYYARGDNGLDTGGGNSINTELLQTVGATNVAADLPSDGLSTVTTDQIRDWKPDLILTANQDLAHKILGDPGWQQIGAVAAKRVRAAPTLPWGWVESPPGVNRLIGLEWLSALLHPDRPQPDLRGDTRAFYHLFYQVDLSDAQLDTLLKP